MYTRKSPGVGMRRRPLIQMALRFDCLLASFAPFGRVVGDPEGLRRRTMPVVIYELTQ